jgi:major membrane immunogen (membrane-anchored lipoprotein)
MSCVVVAVGCVVAGGCESKGIDPAAVDAVVRQDHTVNDSALRELLATLREKTATIHVAVTADDAKCGAAILGYHNARGFFAQQNAITDAARECGQAGLSRMLDHIGDS